VDVGAAFVADAQAAALVQPADRALDDPALAAESGAMLALRSSDGRPGPSSAQFPAAGAVYRAWTGLLASPTATNVQTVDHRTRPIDSVGLVQLRQQHFVQPPPHSLLLPLLQATPARHARAAAHLLR
jgi:hypothetical protein